MNLAAHLLKKDIRHVRVLLSVWLLLVVLQCVLIGVGANPGDHLMQAFYTVLSQVVPLFQALMLIVVVPQVIQDEPLVGTTAFWFTRPISRGTLLKSKAIFALLVLLIPPLAVELIVMAANGVAGHDLALAAPEIVMKQTGFILCIAILAVVTANFGRFAVLGVVALVAMILISLGIFWATIMLHPENMVNQAGAYSLGKSREVAGEMVMIIVAGALVVHQYLTRKTVRTLIGAGVGLTLLLSVQNFWPWDILKPQSLPSSSQDFSSAKIIASLNRDVTSNDVMSMRGQESPSKNIQAQIVTEGVPNGYIVDVKGVHPHLATADGQPIDTKASGNNFVTSSERNPNALESALGGTPVVNASDYSNCLTYTPLFTVDSATYAKYVSVPLKLSATVDFVASRYVLTAEMPLAKGSRYDHGSEHVVITDVLHQPDGVDIVMRERSTRLLFDRGNSENPQLAIAGLGGEKTVYLLLNKKRREAVFRKTNNMNGFEFMMNNSGRLVNRPFQLSFGPEENRSQFMPDITPEWLADAMLERLDLVPVAAFSKEISVDKFTLHGEISSIRNHYTNTGPDKEALGKITFPANATKAQVKDYLNAIMVASRKQDEFGDGDPQIGMIEKIGPDNIDVLIGLAGDHGAGRGNYYLSSAIERMVRPGDKALILQALPDDRDLADLVVKYGWQADARDTLLAGLEHEKQALPPAWIKAIALLQDPSTYSGLKSYLVNGDNRKETFDAIKQLPGIDLSDSVDQIWKKARYGDSDGVLDACDMAAEFGHADAVETAAGVLKKEKNQYERKRAREVITRFTPAAGDDSALIAWVESNRGKLVFDNQTGKFTVTK